MQAPRQQSGHGKQQHRQRELRHEERRAGPGTARACAATRVPVQHGRGSSARGGPCRQQAERNGDERGHDARRDEDSPVRRYVEHQRDVRGWRPSADEPRQQHGDRKAEQRAAECQAERLGTQLPQQSPAAGADGDADDELTCPAAVVGHHQARQVQAHDAEQAARQRREDREKHRRPVPEFGHEIVQCIQAQADRLGRRASLALA